MFCICGLALLTLTYVLVSHFSGHLLALARHAPLVSRPSAGTATLPHLPSAGRLQAEAQAELTRQHSGDLHELLLWSLVALAVMTLASVALGWFAAGRVLAPLRMMTVRTRRISRDNLHERLALAGPEDELKELGDTVDALLERLESAFDAQRRFVDNASHELRTPMARIRTALDVAVAKPGPVPAELLALEVKVREGLDRADHLMDGLLALGRAEHGELVSTELLALHDIAATVIDEHQGESRERGITVAQDLQPAFVHGSATLISRMVANVIENGVRHNDPGGWMHVGLTSENQIATLTVDTGGASFEQQQVESLTQPFRRLIADRVQSSRGAGLGLSIVAAIARAHSGRLLLQARRGGGLQVRIELPARRIRG
jgi:signal transduction histidine kinase